MRPFAFRSLSFASSDSNEEAAVGGLMGDCETGGVGVYGSLNCCDDPDKGLRGGGVYWFELDEDEE